MFAVGSLPSKPVKVYKDDLQSTGSSIVIRWDSIMSDTLPVLGYRVYADNGKNDKLRLVYDGSSDA